LSLTAAAPLLAAALLAQPPPYFQIESVRLRFTYYDQQGIGYQSAAGPAGQPGSEQATILQPQAEVVARIGDRITQRIWIPVDVITAASPDHSRFGKPIDAPDAVTTASRVNTAGALDVVTTYRASPTAEVFVDSGFHMEEPFFSWTFGTGARWSLADDNAVLGASVYQIEDAFDRFDINGQRHGRASRSTTSANVTLTQLLSPTTVAALAYGATLQAGTLGNTWSSVLLADGTRGDERLPRERVRHALSGRLAQWLPWRGALRVGYRVYLDDWGIAAHTVDADLAQRLTPRLYLRAGYRVHRQAAARFFTTAADPNDTGWRTADSDLAGFVAQSWSGAIVVDVDRVRAPRDLHVDIGYERYVRSNDLHVDVTTCGLGFRF
jgi:hypothetical protein